MASYAFNECFYAYQMIRPSMFTLIHSPSHYLLLLITHAPLEVGVLQQLDTGRRQPEALLVPFVQERFVGFALVCDPRSQAMIGRITLGHTAITVSLFVLQEILVSRCPSGIPEIPNEPNGIQASQSIGIQVVVQPFTHQDILISLISHPLVQRWWTGTRDQTVTVSLLELA
jgi:hypothetical protein